MKLSELSSELFLYLVTFRRQVRKGLTPDLRAVKNQLLDIFDRMDRRASDDAGTQRLYEKAKYALVVTADELLINANWAYSAQWEYEILEYDFFKTRIAGDKFFEEIEDMSESDDQLADVYYQCLALGFVGRYKDDAEELRRLKRRLYRMLPGRISEDEKRITPDAYYVAEGTPDTYKPLVNFGRILIVCLMLMAFIGVAYAVTKRSIPGSIRGLAQEMREGVKQTDSSRVRVQSEKKEEPLVDLKGGGDKPELPKGDNGEVLSR